MTAREANTAATPAPAAKQPADTGGAHANLSGAASRVQVEVLLRACWPAVRVRPSVHLGRGPYDRPAVADFVISGPRVQTAPLPAALGTTKVVPKDGLAIDVVAQHAHGSGDQKLPFRVLLSERYRLPALIVYDGVGFQPGALRWLRNQGLENPRVSVMSMREFHRWVARFLHDESSPATAANWDGYCAEKGAR